MFPTQSKVYRSRSLWLLPVVALAIMLVGYAVFAASTAHAQTTAGDVCVEGIVIDWQEKPLDGWVVTLTADLSSVTPVTTTFTPITTTSAAEPDEDESSEYGNSNYGNSNSHYGNQQNFPYPVEKPNLEEGEFKFSDMDISNAFDPAGVRTGTYTVTIESRAGWEGVTPTSISFPIEAGQDGCVKIRFKMRQIVLVDVYKIDANHLPLGDWTIRAVPGPGNLFASPQEEDTSDPVTVTVPASTTVIVTGGIASFTLTPGLWIFTEQAPEPDKDDPNAVPESFIPIVPPTGRQELVVPDDLDPAEVLRVVFKNELVTGCFIVEKLGLTEDPTAALGASYNVGGWGFKLLRKDGTVARQGVTDALGQLRFDNLPLGPYVVVEEDRPGWDEVTDKAYDYTVDANRCDPGPEQFILTFENRQDDSGFCIEGNKYDVNGGYGIAGWEMAADPLAKGGYDPKNVFTDGLGHFKFTFPSDDYRIPGAEYQICELGKDGWTANNPTCQKVRLPEWPGACVQLEDFVNQQVGHQSDYPTQYPEGKTSEYPSKGSESNSYQNGPQSGPQDSSYPQGGQQEGSYPQGGQQESSYPQGGQQESSYPQGGQQESSYPQGGQQEGSYPQGGQQEGSYPQGGQQESSYPQGGQGGSSYGNSGQQCSTYHVVKAGEGLYEIGSQYQKTPQQMLDANPSVSGDDLVIYEGQSICIP